MGGNHNPASSSKNSAGNPSAGQAWSNPHTTAKVIKEQFTTTETSISELNFDNKLIRCYKLNQLPPNGIRFRLKNMFKSLIACEVHSVTFNGKFMPSMSLVFTDQNDFKEAKTFKIQIGSIETVFKLTCNF